MSMPLSASYAETVERNKWIGSTLEQAMVPDYAVDGRLFQWLHSISLILKTPVRLIACRRCVELRLARCSRTTTALMHGSHSPRYLHRTPIFIIMRSAMIRLRLEQQLEAGSGQWTDIVPIGKHHAAGIPAAVLHLPKEAIGGQPVK